MKNTVLRLFFEQDCFTNILWRILFCKHYLKNTLRKSFLKQRNSLQHIVSRTLFWEFLSNFVSQTFFEGYCFVNMIWRMLLEKCCLGNIIACRTLFEWNYLIAACLQVGEKLGKLEVEKRRAIEREDYDLAKARKVIIDWSVYCRMNSCCLSVSVDTPVLLLLLL